MLTTRKPRKPRKPHTLRMHRHLRVCYAAAGKASIITPAATSTIPTIASNLRLPGQYEDVETGLHYNYRRYYDTQTGRYMTQDPIGYKGGLNHFSYVNGDPINFRDPLGLWSSQKGAYVHQRAGYLAFGGQINRTELLIINSGHEWADNPSHQTADYTFMHAMRHPSQSAANACAQTNQFVEQTAKYAISARKAGRRNESLFLFAVALHTIQDSTSPSHRGFQEWSGAEGPWDVVTHIFFELIDPFPNSELDRTTRRTWSAFQNNNVGGFKLNCTCQ